MVVYNKIILLHQDEILGTSRPTWLLLGPTMHHYRCQNFYILSTTSERIVDTFEFSPHNSPVSQLSSTDKLLIGANDMANAITRPHPELPFTQVGDGRIELAQLAIF
jgi:hypothetical protein